MSTPYILPLGLTAAPLGISWAQIPGKDSTPQQRFAEQLNLSWRATHMVDSYCNQILRATLDTEELTGPDYWMAIPNVESSAPARLHAVRWPIIQVLAGQVSASASFPPQWTALDSTNFLLDYSVSGDTSSSVAGAAGAGPSAILIKPGIINWALGRRGWRLNVSYLNGWPHAGITTAATAGASTLLVDDVTGFAVPGSSGNAATRAFIYDDDLTEEVVVNSAVATSPVTLSLGGGSLTVTVQAGPGTLTLANPLLYTHNRMVQNQPTIISSLPESVLWATMLYAASEALTRGATATTIQALPGSSVNTAAASGNGLIKQAQEILQPYRRVL